jgi:hypothetical protein
VAHAEARDRRVIGRLVGGDDAEGDVLATAALDRSRGANANGIGVDQQRHHHCRVMRRATMAVLAIGAIEGGQVKLVDDLRHTPRQVIVGQPLPQAGPQQQLLIAIARQEVLRHRTSVLTLPDRPPARNLPGLSHRAWAPSA